MTRVSCLLAIGLLASCEGSPAAYEGITGTPPATCSRLYDRVEDTIVQVIARQQDLQTCEQTCTEDAEAVTQALLLFVEAFSEWSSCGSTL